MLSAVAFAALSAVRGPFTLSLALAAVGCARQLPLASAGALTNQAVSISAA